MAPEIDASKRNIAELVGTMVLVLMGCGSAIIVRLIHWIQGNGFYFRSYGVSYGLRNSGISGCHINPAISILMLVVGKLGVKETVLYVVF